MTGIHIRDRIGIIPNHQYRILTGNFRHMDSNDTVGATTLLFSLNHRTDRAPGKRAVALNHHRPSLFNSRRIAIDKISESSRGVSCFSNRRAQRRITFEIEPPDNS
jgi:hypothetical protein